MTRNELLNVLCTRIRVMTTEQVGQMMAIESGLDTFIRQLESANLVVRRRVLARPVLRLVRPVVAWRPGEPLPEFGRVAYRLQQRWSAPLKATEIVIATKVTAKRRGGCFLGRWPRASEISHDVNLAGVYLWFRKNRPADAVAWLPEAQQLREGLGTRVGSRLPDALIHSNGAIRCVIEFGGSYRKHKLVSFHAQNECVPYEIW